MKSTKRRTPLVLVAAVLALACGLFATAAPAGAADACVLDPQDYGSPVAISTSATTVDNGTSVEIFGSGFPANCDVTLEADGAVLGTATTDADGNFSFDWAIPDDYPAGMVTIAATSGGEVLATTVLEIVDAQTATSTTVPGTTDPGGTTSGVPGQSGTGTGTLAATGAQIGVLVVGGLVMLAAGVALLMWNRGRQVSTQL